MEVEVAEAPASAPEPHAAAVTESAPPRAPTLAEVIRNAASIRRDGVAANAAKLRVETPKPLASDVEALEAMYARGTPWATIATNITSARPYELPRAQYSLVLETGASLARTAPQKILQSFVRDHNNPVLADLFDKHLVGQLSKLPGGNLRLKVKTREACMQLERQTVQVLGASYQFKEFDVLEEKFFLDVSSIDSDIDTDRMMKRLYELGCQPLYDTFREVNVATGITTSTWRVYFVSKTCPSVLMIRGSVCDQVQFDGRLFPAHGKNAPYPSQRLPFGYRSDHALDLTDHPPLRGTEVQPPAARPTQRPAAPNHARPFTSALQRAAAAAPAPSAVVPVSSTTPSPEPSPSVELSVSAPSSRQMTPPGSPVRQKALPQPPMGGTDIVPTRRRNKRRRDSGEYSNVLKEASAIVTSNYYDVLTQIETSHELMESALDPSKGPSFQIQSKVVRVPDEVKKSKEASHFMTKRNSKVVKTDVPVTVAETAEAMTRTAAEAEPALQPDRLALADSRVKSAQKVLKNVSNPDKLIQFARQSPIALNQAILKQMGEPSSDFKDVAEILLVNRIFAASQPGEDTTFLNKWTKFIGSKMPSKREDQAAFLASLWQTTPEVANLVRVTRALAFFELMLMCTAPYVYHSDHWVQHCSRTTVGWIPAHYARLLHPNTLLGLLRSRVGELCLLQWHKPQFQSELWDILEDLAQSDRYFDQASAVLQLQVVDGVTSLVAGPLLC